jgi:ligand-binding SRPBCC domain-containing protein
LPTFNASQRFAFPLGIVFDFFRRPANVVSVAPPELSLNLIEAPELIEAGSRIVVEVRRWGISQRIVTEVVEFVENQRIVEEQRLGPIRAWRHVRYFAESDGGTEVAEKITFEPPGGMLGLTLTAGRIEEELRIAFAHREERINERLRQGSR